MRAFNTLCCRAAWCVLSSCMFEWSSPAYAQVRDEAAFFSPQAVSQADEIISQTRERTGKDIVIETYPAIPDKLRASYSPDQKQKFYEDWVISRRKQNGADVMILLTREPGHLEINTSDATVQRQLTKPDREEAAARMGAAFRDKQYDRGLIDTLELLSNHIDPQAKVRRAAEVVLQAALADIELIVDPADKQKAEQQLNEAREFVDHGRAESPTTARGPSKGLYDQASIQLKAGNLAGAKSILPKIDDESLQRLLSREISIAQVEAGEVAGAMATVASVTDAYSRALILADIAVASAKRKDTAGFKQTIDQATSTALSVKEIAKRAMVYGNIAAAQAQTGDATGSKTNFAAAKAMATQIQDELSKYYVFHDLAVVQAKSGEAAGAKLTFAKAIEVARQIEEPRHISLIDSLAKDQARLGDTNGAIETADRYTRSWVVKKVIYCYVAMVEAKRDDLAAAYQTALKLKQFPGADVEEAYRYIAAGRLEIGDAAGAIEWITRSSDDPRLRVPQYVEAIRMALSDASGS